MAIMLLIAVCVAACVLLALFVDAKSTSRPASVAGEQPSGGNQSELRARCQCGAWLRAPAKWAGKRGLCPYCRCEVEFPKLVTDDVVQAEVVDLESAPQPDGLADSEGSAPAAGDHATGDASSNASTKPPVTSHPPGAESTTQAVHFLDPPRSEQKAEKSQWARQMLAAAVDPRSIQWMLVLGGVLMVVGLIVWLISLGVFDDPRIVAGLLTLGSLTVIAGGCLIALRTRHQTAGRALAFLGCVLAPLNLWYFHAQGLITLDQNLWLGGVCCCALYAAVVYRLRDPLFMYAVEAGITLTVVLLMADLGWVSNVSNLSLALTVLGILSIHLERSFPPKSAEFSRDRFGLPLFWCGHAQLGAGLILLLAAQGLDWILDPATRWIGIQWAGTGLAQSHLLAGVVWIMGAYAYLYSDFVVRRVGVYTVLAAACVVMAELTMLGFNVHPEALIGLLAVTGAVICLLRRQLDKQLDKTAGTLANVLPAMGLFLSGLPLLVGALLHVRATSDAAVQLGWSYETNWTFVGAMLLVVAANRLSSFLTIANAPREAAAYLFFSAGAAVIAVAGSLRLVGLDTWPQQAPLLMALPLFYLLASRWWRGLSPQRPFEWVAHASSAVILTGAVNASWEVVEAMAAPVVGEQTNLLLAVVFLEATLFYILAAVFRRRSPYVYLAATAGCGAVWQLVGYLGFPAESYTILFAGLGLTLLVAARIVGLEKKLVYRGDGDQTQIWKGPGMAAFHCSSAMLCLAYAAALFQGLADLATGGGDWISVGSLAATSVIAMLSVAAAPVSGIRRFYATASIVLAGLTVLSLQFLLDLSGWRQFELFCLATGIGLLVAGYVGRFQESEDKPRDSVSLGLWLGSILAAGAPMFAVLAHRFFGNGPSMVDEFTVLTVTVIMLATGYSMQIKAPALLGGATLVVYLAVLILSLAYFPQVAIGVYLAIGGGVLFGVGLLLSVYRDRLAALPDRVARREGVFRMITWR